MAQIAGIHVTNGDAWWLIDELRTIGRADDATAAVAIEIGVTADEPIEWLTPAQMEAVIGALAYGPASLEPLRKKLARDHRDRNQRLVGVVRAGPVGS